MYLTSVEEKMLNGEEGEAVSIAMKVLVKVGEALGAEKLIPIAHAHVSGISYLNIRDPGLEFIEYLSRTGAKVKVYSTLNPSSFDSELIELFNLTHEEIEKQVRIVNALIKMGFDPTLTCTPYYLRKPKKGEHLAWGESSAVAYANIVLGARTNKEGGPLALFAALTGRTYYAGLHIEENRIPRIYVKVKTNIDNAVKAGLLGYYVGEISRGRVAFIEAKFPRSEMMMKSFSAALATSSDNPLAIIDGISPETSLLNKDYIEEAISVDDSDLREVMARLSAIRRNKISMFFIGCPHLGLKELEYVYDVLSRQGVKEKIILSTSKFIYNVAEKKGLINKLKELGVIVIKDTCPIVSRLKIEGAIKTNSVKAAFYIRRLHGLEVVLDDL